MLAGAVVAGAGRWSISMGGGPARDGDQSEAAKAPTASPPAANGGPGRGAGRRAGRAAWGSATAGRRPVAFAVDLSKPDAVQAALHATSHAPGCCSICSHGRVLWRREPDAAPADREPDQDDDRAVGRGARVPARPREDHQVRRSRLRGSTVGVLPKGKKVQLEALLNGLLLVSGNDAAVALAQSHGGRGPPVRAPHEPARRRAWPFLHAFLESAWPRGSRQSLLRRGPRDSREGGPRRGRIRRISGASRAIVKLPDQGRATVPLQQQPAGPLRIPGSDRVEDRLHRPRRPLDRRDREARANRARSDPAPLARHWWPGDEAARPWLSPLQERPRSLLRRTPEVRVPGQSR